MDPLSYRCMQAAKQDSGPGDEPVQPYTEAIALQVHGRTTSATCSRDEHGAFAMSLGFRNGIDDSSPKWSDCIMTRANYRCLYSLDAYSMRVTMAGPLLAQLMSMIESSTKGETSNLDAIYI